MTNYKLAPPSNRVTAIFQHATPSFDIEPEVTLAKFAERLSILGKIHGGLPLSVDVRVAAERAH
jgi:hypothetical protein